MKYILARKHFNAFIRRRITIFILYSTPMDGYIDFSNGKLQEFGATHYIFCRSLNVSQNTIINFDFLAKIKGFRELIARQSSIKSLAQFPPTMR